MLWTDPQREISPALDTSGRDLPPLSFYQQHEMGILTGVTLGSVLVAALLIRGGVQAWDNRAKIGNTIIDALAVGLRQYRKLAAKVRTLRTEIENRAKDNSRSTSAGNSPPLTAPKQPAPSSRNSANVLAGPISTDGIVARWIKDPNGSDRIEVCKRGAGWVSAGGSVTFDEFIPGASRPASARDAARVGMPISEIPSVF